MSRIGKQPVEIPDGVEVKVDEANVVTVRGPRGELSQVMHPTMRVLTEEGVAGSRDRSWPTWSKG